MTDIEDLARCDREERLREKRAEQASIGVDILAFLRVRGILGEDGIMCPTYRSWLIEAIEEKVNHDQV